MNRFLTVACCLLPVALLHAAPPERIYFADAKISFTVPEAWSLDPTFPYGPIFTRQGAKGAARIACAISQPLSQTRIQTDLPIEQLKELGRAQMTKAHATLLTESEGRLAGQNAAIFRWTSGDGTARHQSVYFFVDNRIYALELQAAADDFDTMAEGFKTWLGSLEILRRAEAGSLHAPSHGGLWIHQTAGGKIALPDTWGVGAANDTELAAAFVQGKTQGALTVTVQPMSPDTLSISESKKKELKKALDDKGFKIRSESLEPFHGYPSYRILYEGYRGERFIHGTDMLVISPKAHWLFSFDADSSLFRFLAPKYADILNEVTFF